MFALTLSLQSKHIRLNSLMLQEIFFVPLLIYN